MSSSQSEGLRVVWHCNVFCKPSQCPVSSLWESRWNKTCCLGAVARDFPTSNPRLSPSLTLHTRTHTNLTSRHRGSAFIVVPADSQLMWTCRSRSVITRLRVCLCVGPVGQSDIILFCCCRPAEPRSTQSKSQWCHSFPFLPHSLWACVLWSIRPD